MHLNAQGLAVTAMLLEALELLGCPPVQLQLLPLASLDKPKGGNRPIFLSQAVLRFWARARRAIANTWLLEHPWPYWATGTVRASEDTVWRQATKAQTAMASQRYAAHALWDLFAYC